MKGMHCLVCLEKGPDLVIEQRSPMPHVVKALEMPFEFDCACGRHWCWIATATRAGITYRVVTDTGAADDQIH